MSSKVISGGMCTCSFGVAPSALTFLPKGVLIGKMPVGTMTDAIPMINIKSFGMCSCPANPAVIAATAAAMGTPTPAPCVPIITGTWVPSKPTVLAAKQPVLSVGDKTFCTYGGVISITVPGQFMVM